MIDKKQDKKAYAHAEKAYMQGTLFPYLSLIHISEPTRRTPISYAVFCLKKKKDTDSYLIFGLKKKKFHRIRRYTRRENGGS